MFIFHDLKIIYIQVPGTGSNSFQRGMQKYKCEMANIRRNHEVPKWTNIRYPSMVSHFIAKQAKALIDPDIWDSYEKIGFVRHPYKWVVTMYRKANTQRNFGISGSLDLSEFVRDIEKTNFYWFLDDDGNMLIDTVYRTEDLDTTLFDKFGIKHNNIRSQNVHSSKLHTISDLSEADKEIIKKKFYREFEYYKD